ncbi:MAG: hypothetical protein AAB460_02235 [Patescibacteria group bacterium]
MISSFVIRFSVPGVSVFIHALGNLSAPLHGATPTMSAGQALVMCATALIYILAVVLLSAILRWGNEQHRRLHQL